MPLELIQVKIAEGETESANRIPIIGFFCGLYMPADWTAADISFKAAKVPNSDDLYPVTFTALTAAAGAFVPVDYQAFLGAVEVVLVSSTAQLADRVLTAAIFSEKT